MANEENRMNFGLTKDQMYILLLKHKVMAKTSEDESITLLLSSHKSTFTPTGTVISIIFKGVIEKGSESITVENGSLLSTDCGDYFMGSIDLNNP